MQIWIEGAPLLGQALPEEIKQFISEHLTCRLPDPVTEPLLHALVTSQNMHRCRPSYCFKARGSKRALHCRSGFPRPTSNDLVLHNIKDVVKHRGMPHKKRKMLYSLVRTVEEQMVSNKL